MPVDDATCRELPFMRHYEHDEEQIEKARAVFNAFAKMETRLKEYERPMVIYKVRRGCSSAL